MEFFRGEPIQKILRLANRLEKDPEHFRTAPPREKPVRAAVLGSCSIQHFVRVFRLCMDRAGIETEIYQGEYDGINMDVLDDASPLYAFGADFVILLTHWTDTPMASPADLLSAKQWYTGIFQHLDRIPGVTVIVSNMAVPPERAFGTLEGGSPDSAQTLYRELNLWLASSHPANVRILDLEYLSSYYGKQSWFDETAYFLTKQGFSLDYLGPVAAEAVQMILPALGIVRKCLVLDLDNTLWGGVAADEGPLGISVDPGDPLGEAYRAFQSYVLSLKNRGVILAVNSKNDEETAREPFLKNPNMILKLSDFGCFIANWEDKASNMARIAKSLNIGIDSLVFFDDNPAERDIVQKFCPEVLVVDVPEEPEHFVRALDGAAPFEWTAITEEDRARPDSYRENARREEMAQSFVNYTEYLKALQMEGHASLTEDSEEQRFIQLTNKSNQFNLRTRRYTAGEVREMRTNPEYRCLSVTLSDRFSRYGVIACMVLKRGSAQEGLRDGDCFIENWCMSCRVLKRSVENFTLKKAVEEARKMGCTRLVGEYIPTKKNSMVKELYPELGFRPVEGTDRFLYEYDLSEDPAGEIWIQESVLHSEE